MIAACLCQLACCPLLLYIPAQVPWLGHCCHDGHSQRFCHRKHPSPVVLVLAEVLKSPVSVLTRSRVICQAVSLVLHALLAKYADKPAIKASSPLFWSAGHALLTPSC